MNAVALTLLACTSQAAQRLHPLSQPVMRHSSRLIAAKAKSVISHIIMSPDGVTTGPPPANSATPFGLPSGYTPAL